MTTLEIGDAFPDITLPDHRNVVRRISSLTKPSPLDARLGFTDGYPLIDIFNRGFFCPRDQEQLRQLVGFQSELAVNFCKLVTISADPPLVQAAFRAGLGANWSFLSDETRGVIKALDILDETEGEYAYRAQPYTFVLRPDLSVYKIYNGWFFVGRPTVEELRHDLRAIMETRRDYAYDAYTAPEGYVSVSLSKAGPRLHRSLVIVGYLLRMGSCIRSTWQLVSALSGATRQIKIYFFTLRLSPARATGRLDPERQWLLRLLRILPD